MIDLGHKEIPIERCPSCSGVLFQERALLEPGCNPSRLPLCRCKERDVRGFEITNLRYSERQDGLELVLCVEMTVRDRMLGVRGPAMSRERVYLPTWERMDPKMRAVEARIFVLRALEHELDECFYVRGVRVFDPHKEDR